MSTQNNTLYNNISLRCASQHVTLVLHCGALHVYCYTFMYAFRLIFVLSVCCCYGVSINDDDDKLETVVSLSLSQLICPYLSFHCSSISQLPQWRINVMSRGRV